MKFLGYCRVSTDKQADKGISLEAQQSKIKAYCDLYDYQLVGMIVDAGESAKSLEREGIRQALDRLEAGESDGLVIYKLDRLTRSVTDLSNLIKKYFNNGYALLSVCEQLDTKSATGRAMVKMITLMSEWEREIISERTADAMQHKASAGFHMGKVPFGYQLIDGKLAKDADTYPTVELMMKWREAGDSLQAIANKLNKQQWAKPWNKQTVSNVLKREKQMAVDELVASAREYLA